MSKGTNLGSRDTTGVDLWMALTEPTPVEPAGASYALLAYCNGVPPTTANKFKHGCLMIQMDTTNGSPSLYQNSGSIASPVWDLVGNLGAGTVTLADLAAGITPSHVVKFAGKHTTTGGAASEAFTVTGVAATDIVLVTIQTVGGTARTIVSAAPTLNTITIVFSGDPSTDHIVAYQVLRVAS